MPFIDFEALRGRCRALPVGSVGLESTAAEVHADEAVMLDQALQRLAARQAEVRAMGGDLELTLAVEDEVGSQLQSFFEEALSSPQAGPYALDGREVKFDEHDLGGWIKSFFTWRRSRGRHAWIAEPGAPLRIRDGARVALLGDWGTGSYGALPCTRTIEAADPPYDVVIHLGDVYYSGTHDEVRRRFLELWPRVPGAVNRACNSNHEMYAGGFGYFDLTLPRFGQAASFFCLDNDHYRIIGLDSGYDEGDLAGEQGAWARDLAAGAAGRRIVLLSHHQPFSLRERRYDAMVARLRPLLEERRIFAWYWGHEHRCVVYERHPAWGFHGRCIGHSGYPYFRDRFDRDAVKVNADGSRWFREVRPDVPSGLVLDGENRDVPDRPARYGPNGFAALELAATAIDERILGADGTELLRTRLV